MAEGVAIFLAALLRACSVPTSTAPVPPFLSQVLLHWDTIYGSVIASRSSLGCWPAASLTPSEVKTLTLNKSQGYIML